MSEEDSVEEEHNSTRDEDEDQDSVHEEESDPDSDTPCHNEHPETVTKKKVFNKSENHPNRKVKPVIS